MRSPAIILLGLVLSSFSWAVRAQETIDVSKVTCDHWISNEIADEHAIAMWLNGYYNAKRNNTIVGVQEFKTYFRELESYCIAHRNLNLMQAAQELLKAGNKD